MADRVTSPYNAGLCYFPDEYTDAQDVGLPINYRGMAASEGLGYVPPNTPTNTVVSNDAGGQDQNVIEQGISYAKQLYANWMQGKARDATRENRANLIMDFATAGSVLAAQIIIAGPANVASNEDAFWTGAAQSVQAARPDVWAEAQQAGGWWPVGQPFDMIQPRQQMAAALSAVGITVNQAAISTPFTTTPVPFQVTVAPGVVPPPSPGTTTPPSPGTPAPPVAPGGPSTTTPLMAGSSSSIALIALVGAVVYAATRKRA